MDEITRKAIATERQLRNLPADPPEDLSGAYDDGFDEIARSVPVRMIQGQLVKYIAPSWLINGVPEPISGRQLLVTATAEVWTKWFGGRVVKTIPRQPGKWFPKRDELGDLDPGAWELGLDGKPQDPWRERPNCYAQLCDEDTAEVFTYTTNSTMGGNRAVYDLAVVVARKRRIAGRNFRPVVQLTNQLVPTKRGNKQWPVMKFVCWRLDEPQTATAPADAPKAPAKALAHSRPPPDDEPIRYPYDEPPPYDMPDEDLHGEPPF
jgi:hypothetical protein